MAFLATLLAGARARALLRSLGLVALLRRLGVVAVPVEVLYVVVFLWLGGGPLSSALRGVGRLIRLEARLEARLALRRRLEARLALVLERACPRSAVLSILAPAL